MQTQGCDGRSGPLSLTPEQMSKLADLIAAGEAELSDRLSREQEAALIHEVRVRLRDRLVDLIARRIAFDIALEAGPEGGEERNATRQLRSKSARAVRPLRAHVVKGPEPRES